MALLLGMPLRAVSSVLVMAMLLCCSAGADAARRDIASEVRRRLAATSLSSCLKMTGATVITPTSSSYNSKRLDNNLRTQNKPLSIVYAKTTTQVQKSVRCALQFSKRVVPRCGGHSFEGYSVLNGTVVVDLSRMNSVTVSTSASTASIGAGADLGTVYSKLWGLGRYAYPGGTTGTVGMSGLTLGGGFGFLTRKYGLASDNVVQVSAVLANGSLVTANANTRSDLLWASRGGGGGQYAIITKFKVKVSKQPSGSASYAISLTWPFSVDLAVSAMDWFQSNAPGLSRKYSGDFTIHGDKGGYIKFGGVYLGSKTAAMQMFTNAGLFTALGQPKTNAGYQGPLNSTLGYTYDAGPIAYKSHSVMMLKKYSQAALQALAQGIADGQATIGKLSASNIFELQWHPLGGAVKDLSASATAFPYRSALFNAKLRTAWTNPAYASACTTWVNKINDAQKPYQSPTGYSNYIDADLGADSPQLYFGSNLPRLQKIKAKYDKSNFFRFPNSVTK